MKWLALFGFYVGFLILAVSFVGCGTEREEIPVTNSQATPYTFAEMKAACGKCHNASAPAIPIDNEAAFKASPKIRAEIASGEMPPTPGTFNKARALAYLDGKKPSASGGKSDY